MDYGTSRHPFRINLDAIKLLLIFSAGFFLPWGNSLKTVTPYSPYFFLLPLFCLPLFLLKRLSKVSMPMVVFISFIVVHVLLTIAVLGANYLDHVNENLVYVSEKLRLYDSETTNLTTVIKLSSFMVYFLVMSFVMTKKKELSALCLGFVLGLLLGCAFMFPDYVAAFDDVSRFSGPYNDPNAFAMSAGVAFFLCLMLKWHLRNTFSRFVLNVLAFLFAVMVLLSQSRGGVLALALAGVWWFRKSRNLLKRILIVICGILLLYPFLGERILGIDAWTASRGTGRLDIWITYLSHAGEYFLTGVGVGRSDEAISTAAIAGSDFVPHNVFLEVFVELGIVGLFIFVWVLFYLWRRSGKSGSDYMRTSAIVWCVGAFFISALVLRETWFVFLLLERSLLLKEHRPS